MNKSTCPIPGCLNVVRNSSTICSTHRHRMKRFGSYEKPSTQPVIARFWAKVDKSGECWVWTGTTWDGYGTIRNTVGGRSRMVRAHRFSFELANGPIPEGLLIDHICHNPSCVRPEHLRAVTNKQNGEHRSGPTKGNRSGVRGVTWSKSHEKWQARVRHNQRLVHIGFYDAIPEAEAAVVAKRLELFTHNTLDRIAS